MPAKTPNAKRMELLVAEVERRGGRDAVALRAAVHQYGNGGTEARARLYLAAMTLAVSVWRSK
jgi:hypothetical protein